MRAKHAPTGIRKGETCFGGLVGSGNGLVRLAINALLVKRVGMLG